MPRRQLSDCKCAILHFGSNVISGNKCVRRETLVCDTQYHQILCFQNLPQIMPFFVILTRDICSQSPCNPISQLLSLAADSHTVPARPILILPLVRRDSVALAFGLFRADSCFPSSLGLTPKASAFALSSNTRIPPNRKCT